MFNNKTKTFLLLTLMFVTLLGVSAATAAETDNNATDTTSNTQEAITQAAETASDNSIPTTTVSNKEINKNTQQDVKTDGEANFDELYNDIKDSSEVTLTKDYKHVSGDYGLISINEDKTINGDSHTINSGDINLFTVAQSATLTLKNMKITAEGERQTHLLNLNGNLVCENVIFDLENATSAYANAIFYINTNGVNVSLTGCTIQNYGSSAGIYHTYRSGNLIMDDCTVNNITGKTNGIIRVHNAKSNATIKNSRFINNIAESKPLFNVNVYTNKLEIDACYFEGNEATSNGAVIFTNGNLTVKNSEFLNNKVTGTSANTYGAIYIGNGYASVILEGNTMDDPEAPGAEIYVYTGNISSPVITGQDINANAGEEVTITYTITDDNGNSIMYKDATYSLTVNEETYSATYNRGVISKTITAPDTDGTYPITLGYNNVRIVEGNDVILTNAKLIVGEPKLIIADETYSNFFDADGNIIEGAIPEDSVAYFDGTFTNRKFNINIPMTIDTGDNPAVFDGCTFTITNLNDVTIKNVNFTGEHSASLLTVKANVAFENVSFVDINATSQQVINLQSYSNVSITGCTFKGFNGMDVIGPTSTNQPRLNVNITDSNFVENTGLQSPIRVNSNYWNLNIANSNFTRNNGANGGVIQIGSSRNDNIIIIDNCIFDSNVGSGKAGVLYMGGSRANITVKNSNFTDNGVSGSTSNLASIICFNSAYANLTLLNNEVSGSTAENGTDIYFENVGKIYTDAKLISEDATTEKDQFVDLKFKLTDDMGNLMGFKTNIFAYNATLNDEVISYVPDVYYGKVYGFSSTANKTINATYEPGPYPITLTVVNGVDKFDSLELVDGTLTVIGEPAPGDIIITDATYDQFFDADGNIIEGAIPEGSTAKFDGTFTNRNFNINIPLTIDTYVNPTVFDNCTFTVTNDVTMKNVKVTGGSDSTPVITLTGNMIFDNIDFDGVTAQYAEVIRPNAGSNITVTNCTIQNLDGGDSGMAFVRASSNSNNNIKLDIADSNFVDNYAKYSLIRIHSRYWTVNIKNSNFTDNVGGSGGVLEIMSSFGRFAKIAVDNCNFTNNNGSRAGVIQSSGNATNITVTNSNFYNNVATLNNGKQEQGGAIEINNGYSNITLENNVMEGNEAATGADICLSQGGYIISTVKLTANDATVTQYEDVDIAVNLTDDMGNKVLYGKFTYMVKLDYETIFEGNASKTESITANYEPGNYPIELIHDSETYPSVIVTNANLEVIESPLIKYARLQAMIDEDTTGTITLDKEVRRGSDEESVLINKDIVIDGNGLSINANGGRVFDITDGATVTIKNIVITNVGTPNLNINTAEGRLANISSGNVVFENLTFKDSEAPDFGSQHGSFIHILPGNNIEIKDSNITNTMGTFLNLRNSTGKISNTIFEDNDATETCAIIANGGALTVTDSQFIDNKAKDSIIYGKSHQMSMFGPSPSTMFTSTSLTVDNTTFTGNTVNNWGVIGAESDTIITGSRFENNRLTTSKGGSAVYSNDGKLTVETSVFAGNTVSGNNRGSIIYNAYGDLDITSSILIPVGTQASVYNAASSVTATANGNYWGNNSEDTYIQAARNSGITIDNWVVLEGSVDSDGVSYGDTVQVKVTLNTLNDGSEVISKLPDYGNVTLTSRTGTLTDTTVEMINGEATTTFVVENSPYTITATYPDEEITLTGNAIMPEPQVYILNNGNWTEYFDEETGLVKSWIIPNSELRFEGTFTDRLMIINIPLNLTTADNQAIFNNCPIEIRADNVNVTNIQMNGADTESLITLNNTENTRIESNTLTLTNEANDQTTHTIEVIGGKNNIIKSNNITTTGPEQDIVYSDINKIYTVSIEAIQSENLTIDSNTIKTKTNGKVSTSGTIYGINIVSTNVSNPVQNTQIINNEITTETDNYAYSINLNYVQDATINNNTINTISGNYATAIQTILANNSEFNNNKITINATNMGYGIILNGYYNWNTEAFTISEKNNITNNKISINANDAWGIELWIVNNHVVENNNVTINASNGVAIGLADTHNSKVTNNNITVTATMDKEPNIGDSISSYTAGIKITETARGRRGSRNNTVTNNIIVVEAPNEVPAINLTNKINQNRINNITENYLISPMGYGDNAVTANDELNYITNNYPVVSTITTDKTAYEYKEGTTDNIIITVDTTTTQKGTIEIYLDGSQEITNTINDIEAGQTTITTQELYELINNNSKNTYEVTLVYTNGIQAIPSNTTFTLTVTLNPKVYTLNDGNWTEYFNEDGTLKSHIIPGSELRFEGEFNNRYMEINIPLNITTADTQAKLHNSKFVVKADNVNITNIEMDAVDTQDALITINNTSNTRIENNKLTLTNNEAKQLTHTIEILGGTNNIIKENTITTTGPEEDIVYNMKTGDVITMYLASIYANASEGLIIDSNNITTKANDNEATTLGTIYGINIINLDSTLTSKIINNNITTNATKYAYSIKTSNTTSTLLIKNNNIETTSVHQASSIDMDRGSYIEISDNTISSKANNITYAIASMSYEVDMDKWMEVFYETWDDDEAYEAAYSAKYVDILRNNITTESEVSMPIQLYITAFSDVKYNNITTNAKQAVGIGGMDSQQDDISNNNINLTLTGEETTITGDAIKYVPSAGIKLMTDGQASGGINEIYNNNITITIPEEVIAPAINLTKTRENEIHDNYLLSTYGVGDNSVYVEYDDDNTIEDNIPVQSVVTTDKESYDFQADADENIIITIVPATSKGNMSVFIDGAETPVTSFVNVTGGRTITTSDFYDLINDISKESYEVTLVYASEDENVLSSNTTFTFKVNRKVTSISYNVINDIEGKVAVEVLLLDEDEHEIDSEIITLTGNEIDTTVKSGRLFKDTTLTPGDYELTAKFDGNKAYKPSETNINFTVIADPNKTIEELNDTINDLNNNITDLNNNITDLNNNLSKAEEKIAELTQNNIDLANNLTEANNKIDELTQNNTELNDKLDQANQNIINLTNNLTEANNKINELTQNNTELKQQLNETNNKLDEANQNIADLNNTNKELANNLTKAQEDISALEQANNNLTNELNDTNAKLDDANNKIDNLTAANDKLASDVAAANKKVDDLTKANNNLAQELNDTNNKLDEANSKVDNLTAANDKLAGDVAAANKKVDDLNKANSDLNNQLADTNKKLADANAKVDNLTAANDKLADDVAAANKKVDDLAKTNDDLAKQLDDTTKRVEDIVKAVDNLNKQLNDTQNKVNDLSKEVADKDKIIEELTAVKSTKVTVNKINSTTYGSSVTITGTLTDSDNKAIGNGVVTLKLNGGTVKAVTNGKGVYSYSTKNAKVGTNNVTVSYAATDKYTTSSAKTTFKVTKATPTLSIDAIKSVRFKDQVTITGSLIGVDNRVFSDAQVTLKINSKSVSVKTNSKGVFTYTTKATDMGTNNVTATYAGNTNYNKVTKKATFKVTKQDLVLTVDRVAASVKFKDDLAISGKLVDGNGKAVMNTQVTIKINDKTYKAKTDKTGSFVLKTRATIIGTNNVVASYAGNAKYNKATAKTSFNVAKQDLLITYDAVTYANGKVTVKGTFIDRNKRPLMNSVARITLNGKQGTSKTNSEGTFTYTTKASKGAYKLTLAYPGNNNYNAYSKTSTISVA